MVRAAVLDDGVQVGAGVVDEASEEVFSQFGLEVADQADLYLILIYEGRTATQVERHEC